MHLINKPNTSRRNSRELSLEDRTESELNMDYDCTYVYAAPPDAISKQRGDKRQSRIRTSFFGGGNKRGSPSRMTVDKGDQEAASFTFGRQKLRKASSKVSLRSMSSMTIHESPDEKSGYRSLSEILRGGRMPYGMNGFLMDTPYGIHLN